MTLSAPVDKTFTHSAPAFEYTVSSETVIKTLDTLITRLEEAEEDDLDDVMHDVRQTLSAWQVVTTDDGTTRRLLAEPITAKGERGSLSLMNRLKHMIQTKGEWRSKHHTTYRLCVASMLDVPLALRVAPATLDIIREEGDDYRRNPTAMLVALVALYQTFEKNAALGHGLGVFQSPGAVLALNVMADWLRQYDQAGRDVSQGLRTENLLDLIKTADIYA